jgi:hypothetical protein
MLLDRVECFDCACWYRGGGYPTSINKKVSTTFP